MQIQKLSPGACPLSGDAYETLYDRLVKNGAGGFATVGAGEAIDFFKNLIMQLMKGVIDLTRISLLQVEKNFFILNGLIF